MRIRLQPNQRLGSHFLVTIERDHVVKRPATPEVTAMLPELVARQQSLQHIEGVPWVRLEGDVVIEERAPGKTLKEHGQLLDVGDLRRIRAEKERINAELRACGWEFLDRSRHNIMYCRDTMRLTMIDYVKMRRVEG